MELGIAAAFVDATVVVFAVDCPIVLDGWPKEAIIAPATALTSFAELVVAVPIALVKIARYRLPDCAAVVLNV